MHYFKHSELVDRYHVSLKTVHNWIDAVKQNKLDLKLYESSGRTYIENTAKNVMILEQLVEKGKKYRNTLHHKVATPTLQFYTLYSRKQILDIISSLNIHKEIPRQYNYFDGGATNWEKFADRMWEEKTPSLLKSTVELMKANLGAIDSLLEGHSRVNVIDIGPGNAVPVRDLLAHLLERGVLHRYIAIDISESMLRIAERNIKEWFGDKIKFEGYVRDITYERFDDVLVDDMLDSDADKTINLALLLGATPMNFQAPYDLLKVIYASIGRDDLLIYTDKPDTEADRRYFDVNADPGVSALSPKYSFIFDLLNIDESLYDVEMGFNNEKRIRYIHVRLKVALTISFKFENSERDVKLDKGDTILLWRAWHQTVLEIVSEFEKTGFTLLHSSLTKDRQYFLSISGIETKQELNQS
ncbi:MAG TPA: L-histidine N(alpha)-methyltransferase [Candidatus Saccharimonadales bacterium]|nr:L-histidine N(alpha)-methyltransferase [Candidatus Saccharimonadales bacterium]